MSPRAPEGLSGPVGELPWLGLPLREQQARAFAEQGSLVSPTVLGRDPDERGGEQLLLREDAVVGPGTLAAALALGRSRGVDLSFRLDGQAGDFARRVAFGRDEPLLAYLADGPPSLVRIAAAEVVLIDPQERLVDVPVPGEGGATLVQLALSDRLLLPAGHWLQLLWANLLGMGPFLWRGLVGRNPGWAALRLAWATARAGSTSPPLVAARLNRRGRGCRVHPSAVVEGCWLGDGVVIDAGAVVRGAVLGDGVTVEEQALAAFSVLSPGARVQRKALVKFSLLGPRAAVGGLVQLSVVDRDAQVKVGAHLMDMALDQGVRVRVDGQLRDAPLGLAGVCVGAGTLIGGGVRVAPGRAVPAGLAVVPPPDTLLMRVPDGLSGTVTVRDGTLVGR